MARTRSQAAARRRREAFKPPIVSGLEAAAFGARAADGPGPVGRRTDWPSACDGADAFDDQGDDWNDNNLGRAASRVSNAFDAAAIEHFYNSGPRIQGCERPPRLRAPGTFLAPFRPTGDTAFAFECANGSRNAIKAEILFMVRTWLQHIKISLADWEDGNRASPPTLDESSDVHSTTRTHISQIYEFLATQYKVLLAWRTDPGWAAALHDAILGHSEAHFTNFASSDFHRIATRDRASHVTRDRGRSLAQRRAHASQASTRGDAAHPSQSNWT